MGQLGTLSQGRSLSVVVLVDVHAAPVSTTSVVGEAADRSPFEVMTSTSTFLAMSRASESDLLRHCRFGIRDGSVGNLVNGTPLWV